MEEAMEETFGLKTMNNETTEPFTGRSRHVFGRLQTEGVDLPSEARGYIVLRGSRLGSLGGATVCMHGNPSGISPQDGFSYEAPGVDELEHRVEDEPQKRSDFDG